MAKLLRGYLHSVMAYMLGSEIRRVRSDAISKILAGDKAAQVFQQFA